jgi:heterodisulfide reductase subunit B
VKYAYYPGCSLEKNASAYHISALAASKPFGIDFVELEDWNCCGATEYVSISKIGSYALIARNLVQAKELELGTNGNGKQLVAPCSACFLNLSKGESVLSSSKELTEKVNQALGAGGLTYQPGGLTVRHLLDIFVNDIGYDSIREKVVNPLSGLRVAPYYGCMVVRPGYQFEYDDSEQPVSLDKLMKTLGATVVDYPLKAQCCGGHMTQISESVAMDLINRLLKNAADYNADVIVTLCPMCQLNLDAYQENVNKAFGTDYKLPILYFTQLVGLAMGLSAKELGIGSEFVDARPALEKIGVEVPESKPARRKRPSKTELPMPAMPEED